VNPVSVAAALALSLTSCGTIVTQVVSRHPTYEECAVQTVPHVYSGTVVDVRSALHYQCKSPGDCRYFAATETANVEVLLLLDVPLSLAYDTLILPWTVFEQLEHGNYCTDGIPWQELEAQRRARKPGQKNHEPQLPPPDRRSDGQEQVPPEPSGNG